MKVIVIEDEQVAAAELIKMVSKLDNTIDIIAQLDSVAVSLNWFRSNPMPDLIFSDIYLSDGTCFDIFHELDNYAPVVFCTAYDQHALQAFNNNGIDYLLKPVSEVHLHKCFEKINSLRDGPIAQHAVKSTLLQALSEILPQYRTTLIVYEKDKIIAVDLKETYFFVSEKNKVLVHTNLTSYTLEKTLDQVMPTLDPRVFFRANRQYIIQRQAVKSIEVLPFRKLSLVVHGCKEAIVISREKKKEFLQWVEGL